MTLRSSGDRSEPLLRTLLWALVLIGTLGLSAELLLLEHFESTQQWLPLAGLGAGLVVAVAVRIRPGPVTFRAFRWVMVTLVVLGLVGLWLHMRGNWLFELEVAPDASQVELLRAAMTGGVPALAPGAMAQLGLLGWIYTFRHPVFHPSRPTPHP